mmetsp:Transcript_43355/g.80637  ORF Transcript_43355/g.80637 Transcript_43355/m.80637 type:complete len:80 (-) Transcript_43355:589-828(-)
MFVCFREFVMDRKRKEKGEETGTHAAKNHQRQFLQVHLAQSHFSSRPQSSLAREGSEDEALIKKARAPTIMERQLNHYK